MIINLPKPTKKELEFIKFRKICTKEIERAFSYSLPPIHLGFRGWKIFKADNYKKGGLNG